MEHHHRSYRLLPIQSDLRFSKIYLDIAGTEQLRLENLELGINLLSLLTGELVIDKLRLDGLTGARQGEGTSIAGIHWSPKKATSSPHGKLNHKPSTVIKPIKLRTGPIILNDISMRMRGKSYHSLVIDSFRLEPIDLNQIPFSTAATMKARLGESHIDLAIKFQYPTGQLRLSFF